MNSYWYQPLPPIQELGRTPPFTRLITLASGRPTDPLRCSLGIINVENAPPYEALSYTWGSDPTESVLWCDGKALAIRSNLDDVLRHMRLPTQARRLWVDAVCIDQQNVEERTRQIQYMRLIYKHATRAVVWLGHRTPGVKDAFELAQRLANIKEALGHATAEADQQLAVELLKDAMTATNGDPPRLALDDLSDLFDREYFVRSWCIQEVVTSTWCMAKCEDLEMNFFDILDAASYVVLRRQQIFPGKPLEFWAAIARERNLIPGQKRLGSVNGSMGSLLYLLAFTRDFKSTDPRDKVFAMLGISDEGLEPILALTKIMGKSRLVDMVTKVGISVSNRLNALGPGVDVARHPALKPDYSKPLVEVYRDLTRFLVRKSPRVLDVLSSVQHLDDPCGSFFPSWVPRWFQPRSTSVLGGSGCFLAGYCDGHFQYFAEVHDSPFRGDPVNPNSLSLDGYRVDRVRVVSEVMSLSLSGAVPTEAVWSQVFDFPLFPRSNRSYRNGEDLDVAFCMTLSASPLGTAMVTLKDWETDPAQRSLPLVKQRSKADITAYLLGKSLSDYALSPQSVTTLQAEASEGDPERFQRAARIFSHNRRFYLTQGGFMGIGPRMMRPGDEVCVLFGGRPCFILRPMMDHHVFIGDTYLHDHDIMWGKVTESVRFKRSQIPVETFELR